jgi:hypothetical protein
MIKTIGMSHGTITIEIDHTQAQTLSAACYAAEELAISGIMRPEHCGEDVVTSHVMQRVAQTWVAMGAYFEAVAFAAHTIENNSMQERVEGIEIFRGEAGLGDDTVLYGTYEDDDEDEIEETQEEASEDDEITEAPIEPSADELIKQRISALVAPVMIRGLTIALRETVNQLMDEYTAAGSATQTAEDDSDSDAETLTEID